MKLYEFVRNHAVRGACMCGKCFDATKDPEKHQPDGHTADMVFFKVAIAASPIKEDFINLARSEYPHWFDGKEHNYLSMGGDMGDQGIALMTMGLGSLLGVWKLMTPKSMLGNLIDDDLEKEMAGIGFIAIQVFQ